MKYLASLLLITSFVGVAILGLVLFDMGPNHSGTGCVVSAIDKTTCPTSIMGMTLRHISILQTLTATVVLSGSNWLLLLATLLLISVSILLLYTNLLFPKLKFLRERLRDLILRSLFSKQKILSWLSLFELSPAFK